MSPSDNALRYRYVVGYLRRLSRDGRMIEDATFLNPLTVYERVRPDGTELRVIGTAEGWLHGEELTVDVTFRDSVDVAPEALNLGMNPDYVHTIARSVIAMSGEITYLIVGPSAWMEP